MKHKKFHSVKGMKELLYMNHIGYTLKEIDDLDPIAWDELGDFLWYRANPNEKDPIKQRKVPLFLQKKGMK